MRPSGNDTPCPPSEPLITYADTRRARDEIDSGAVVLTDAQSGKAPVQRLAELGDDSWIGPEEQREKFGFLLDALAMGAPPHGGIASGIDRLLMALQAFPKNQVGYDHMTGAPIELTQEQLKELGITVKPA